MRRLPAPAPTYAKAGLTPGWERMSVFNRDTGDFERAVIEVDVKKGWLVRRVLDAKGRPLDDGAGRTLYEGVAGRFCILMRPKGRGE